MHPFICKQWCIWFLNIKHTLATIILTLGKASLIKNVCHLVRLQLQFCKSDNLANHWMGLPLKSIVQESLSWPLISTFWYYKQVSHLLTNMKRKTFSIYASNWFSRKSKYTALFAVSWYSAGITNFNRSTKFLFLQIEITHQLENSGIGMLNKSKIISWFLKITKYMVCLLKLATKLCDWVLANLYSKWWVKSNLDLLGK